MLNRLVIGTANWAREYNGHKVSEKEQQLIMEYMKEVGIYWIEVATSYGTLDIRNNFSRIVKIDAQEIPSWHDKYGDILIAHHANCYKSSVHKGASVHRDDKVNKKYKYVELPYSVMDPYLGIWGLTNTKVIARSIFCKGKALRYFSPQECIDFVLMNPRIDKVIIGVDSADQLRENVAHLVKMETFTHDEEVDTRKFERKDL